MQHRLMGDRQVRACECQDGVIQFLVYLAFVHYKMFIKQRLSHFSVSAGGQMTVGFVLALGK